MYSYSNYAVSNTDTQNSDEEDEEAMQWEQEQLRRGGHRTPEPSTPKVKQVYRPAPSVYIPSFTHPVYSNSLSLVPATTTVPTLPPVISRLSQQLAQLTTSHANNTAALNTLALEREQVDEREKEMREMVVKAEDKRAWFGDFRDWIESVASFLDEKVYEIHIFKEPH